MRRVPKKIFTLIILFIIFWAWSYFLLYSYTLGDQLYYHELYRALSSASGKDVMPLAMTYVSSSEPISAYLLWAGAILGVDKNAFISVLNSIFLLGIFILLRRQKSPSFIYLLMFSNFYVIVLMTGAERLKIAYILLVYAAVTAGRFGLSLALASPLAHLQSFILLGGLFVSKMSNHIRSIYGQWKVSKLALFQVIAIASIVGPMIKILQEAVLTKATAYISGAGGLSELLQIFLLAGIALYVTKDRLGMVIMLLVMSVAISLQGGLRVNMIAVTLFLYQILAEGRLQHPFVVALLSYLSLKSVFFIRNIFYYHDGFSGFLL